MWSGASTSRVVKDPAVWSVTSTPEDGGGPCRVDRYLHSWECSSGVGSGGVDEDVCWPPGVAFFPTSVEEPLVSRLLHYILTLTWENLSNKRDRMASEVCA